MQEDIIANLGICPNLPKEMQSSRQVFVDELVMFIRNQFADLNMENYPPPNTALKTT